MIKNIQTAIFLLLLVQLNFAQQDSLFFRSLADHVLTESTAYENLRDLSKNIGHRLSGSPQMYLAEEWGVKVMTNEGLPSVSKQSCMVPNWKRGEQALQVLTKDNSLKLNVIALGNSVGRPNPIVSEVVQINEFSELKTKDIKDKIVFYNYKFNPKFISTFRGYGDAVRYRVYGADSAAVYGANAVIVRSITPAHDHHPHTGTLRYGGKVEKLPALAVDTKNADLLEELIQKNNKLKVRFTSTSQLLPDVKAHNIIGEIKGSTHPDEIILIGGHLDSWDVGEGSHDDGAGVTQSLGAISALIKMGYQPKRTLRVVFFANEENGTRGGLKYAEIAKKNNENHILAIESDAGGFTPRFFGGTMTKDKRLQLQNWKHLFEPYGIYDVSQSGGGADIGPLNREMGTPLVGFYPDSQRYFDYHHTETDVFEAVSKRELELGIINMAGLIYLADKYGF